jgi:hypothetical protein
MKSMERGVWKNIFAEVQRPRTAFSKMCVRLPMGQGCTTTLP